MKTLVERTCPACQTPFLRDPRVLALAATPTCSRRCAGIVKSVGFKKTGAPSPRPKTIFPESDRAIAIRLFEVAPTDIPLPDLCGAAMRRKVVRVRIAVAEACIAAGWSQNRATVAAGCSKAALQGTLAFSNEVAAIVSGLLPEARRLLRAHSPHAASDARMRCGLAMIEEEARRLGTTSEAVRSGKIDGARARLAPQLREAGIPICEVTVLLRAGSQEVRQWCDAKRCVPDTEVARLIAEVSALTGVSTDDVLRHRARAPGAARHACWLILRGRGWSQSAIARGWGGLHPSTISMATTRPGKVALDIVRRMDEAREGASACASMGPCNNDLRTTAPPT